MKVFIYWDILASLFQYYSRFRVVYTQKYVLLNFIPQLRDIVDFNSKTENIFLWLTVAHIGAYLS